MRITYKVYNIAKNRCENDNCVVTPEGFVAFWDESQGWQEAEFQDAFKIHVKVVPEEETGVQARSHCYTCNPYIAPPDPVEQERAALYTLTSTEVDKRLATKQLAQRVNRDAGWVRKLPIFQEIRG